MRRLVALSLAILGGVAVAFASRFWVLPLWSGGLFGIDALPAEGGLVRRWLQGTPFAPFELIVWLAGGVLLLSATEALTAWFAPPGSTDDIQEG
ncbi:hypothetical protein OCH239_12905 [Roseivivax halodurans JCM 10272]|uniref:Uncharacterized protein n=1 Tax=Roseivivax halodurans JCM 10272 TaxID=1449350 RepID=X7EDD6_9RHOB|nr:hypothetical protein [Roseivivax halodurans]ETX13216.1 hypothetical protein OCH239_12905 [Roseivivax halodurans JCM 10272]